MIKYLLLFFVSIFICAFSKAPESIKQENVFISQYTDINTGIVYLEGIPLIAENNDADILSLVPVIKHNKTTQEIEIQFLYSYYPSMAKFETTTIITNEIPTNAKPKKSWGGTSETTPTIVTNTFLDKNKLFYEDFHSINITSFHRTTYLPIIGTTHIVEELGKNIYPQIKTSGIFYVFPDTLSNISRILKETQTNPLVTYKTTTNKYLNNTNSFFTPYTYNLNQLLELYNKSTSKYPVNLITPPTIDYYQNNNNMDSSLKNNQFKITITSSRGSKTFIMNQYYLSILNIVFNYYKRYS